MRKTLLIPALSALTLALVGCASKPNPNLDQARASYSQLQTNPQAATLAPIETKEAADMLSRAELAYTGDNDQKTVDQLAYLTNQRVVVAEETIRMKTAEQILSGAAAQRTQARLDARTAQVDSLLGTLKPQPTPRGDMVTLGDVLFEVDRAELKPAGMRQLYTLGDYLKKNPERQVVVEGFTDSTGTASHNMQLSQRRADSVKVALTSMGIAPQRITTQGYGMSNPVASNDTPDSRVLNRRVEITISPDAQPVAPRVITQ